LNCRNIAAAAARVPTPLFARHARATNRPHETALQILSGALVENRLGHTDGVVGPKWARRPRTLSLGVTWTRRVFVSNRCVCACTGADLPASKLTDSVGRRVSPVSRWRLPCNKNYACGPSLTRPRKSIYGEPTDFVDQIERRKLRTSRERELKCYFLLRHLKLKLVKLVSIPRQSRGL